MTEDKVLCSMSMNIQLEKEGPKLPFTFELRTFPPRLLVTIEKCVPVIFTAYHFTKIKAVNSFSTSEEANPIEDKSIGGMKITPEKGDLGVPFTLEFKTNPPRIMVTPEGRNPISISARQLAEITINTHAERINSLKVEEEKRNAVEKEEWEKNS